MLKGPVVAFLFREALHEALAFDALKLSLRWSCVLVHPSKFGKGRQPGFFPLEEPLGDLMVLPHCLKNRSSIPQQRRLGRQKMALELDLSRSFICIVGLCGGAANATEEEHRQRMPIARPAPQSADSCRSPRRLDGPHS